jgi:uncharacterized membrane protein
VAAVEHPHGAFGQDMFGRVAEKIARFFGTPQYIIGQSIVVVLWIVFNAVVFIGHWDPYPFILLNLGFSLQAAYAAPLILLAQTRQADRDKAHDQMVEAYHEKEQKADEGRVVAIKSETDNLTRLLRSNTDLTRQDKELTEQIAKLTKEIHEVLLKGT